MPAGRPTKYKPEYCQMLIDHMSKGLSIEAFGGVVGCCKDTIYEWVKHHPEFSDAKKTGTTKSRLFWESIANNALLKGQQLNSAVWIFNMKNRFGWADKIEQDIKTENVSINFSADEHQAS